MGPQVSHAHSLFNIFLCLAAVAPKCPTWYLWILSLGECTNGGKSDGSGATPSTHPPAYSLQTAARPPHPPTYSHCSFCHRFTPTSAGDCCSRCYSVGALVYSFLPNPSGFACLCLQSLEVYNGYTGGMTGTSEPCTACRHAFPASLGWQTTSLSAKLSQSGNG